MYNSEKYRKQKRNTARKYVKHARLENKINTSTENLSNDEFSDHLFADNNMQWCKKSIT